MTKKEQQFVDEMTRMRGLDWIRLGMQVEISGDIGTVVSSNSSGNIDVKFANVLKRGSGKKNCHPTWDICYFDRDGKIFKDFRGKENGQANK